MSKIGRLKIFIEFVFFWILIQFLQAMNIARFDDEIAIKLCALYFLMQLLIGRYQGKVLLMYDEIRLLVLSHVGFFFASFLVFPFYSWTFRKLYGFVFLTLFLFVFAGFSSRYTHKWFRKKYKHNTLIVGVGHTAAQLAFVCRGNSYSLLDVQGFVNCKSYGIHQEQVVSKNKTIGIEDVDSFIKSHNIDTVLIAIPELKQKNLNSLFELFKNKVNVIKYLPQVNGLVTFDTKVEDFDGILMISNSRGVNQVGSYLLKRLMDICAGLCGVLFLIPLTVFVFVKNRKEGDKGPIFFTQNRIGKDGKEFKMYKYRTMVLGADKILEELMEKDPAIREEYTVNKKLANDPRITSAGKFLREKSLDEFPQFINVLLGQMSLIGPRPYLPREKEDMGQYYNDVVACKLQVCGKVMVVVMWTLTTA